MKHYPIGLARLGLFCLLFLIVQGGLNSLQAEGIRQTAPSSSDRADLLLLDNTYNNFGRYDGNEDERLYFHIADPDNEQVFLGFSRAFYYYGGTNYTTAYFRIKDPNGNVVYGPQVLDATTANISTWAQAYNGPQDIVGAGGYAPFVFDPATLSLDSGDYYIEFSENPLTASPYYLHIAYYDITVATKQATPQALDGRVFAKNWAFFLPNISSNFDRPFNGRVFVYTDVGFVTKVDFAGADFRPAAFNLAFNNSGPYNTGDIIEDRKSVPSANQSFNDFPVFLNDPDSLIYPTGVRGTLMDQPQVSFCEEGLNCIYVSTNQPGEIQVLIDMDQASGPGLFDDNSRDVLLAAEINALPGEVSPYVRCVSWDGRDGLGVLIPYGDTLNLYIAYNQAVVHFPVYDVEYNTNGFTLEAIRPAPAPGYKPIYYYDDSNIPYASGTGNPNTQINGCLAPCHNWTNYDYGNINTINTWWHSSIDSSQFVVRKPFCPMNAVNDDTTTSVSTAIQIWPMTNDIGVVDSSTLSASVIGTPKNGRVTGVDTNTGLITYLPNPGYEGRDSFVYIICDTLGLCDSATVFITMSCSGSATEGYISGTVFEDKNADQTPNGDDAGQPGVTVRLYRDLNLNGSLDPTDIALDSMATNAAGAFSFFIDTMNLGVGGSFADSALDEFSARSFTGNDGNIDYTNNWQELSETDGATQGRVRILASGRCATGNCLRIGGGNSNINNRGLSREVDLSGATSATLSFIYRRLVRESGASVEVEVSGDGGSNWTTLGSYPLNTTDGSLRGASYDLTSYIASNTQIRFVGNGRTGDDGGYIYFDNIQVLRTGESTPDTLDYLVDLNFATLPAGAAMTGDSLQQERFTASGQDDCQNFFSFTTNLPPQAVNDQITVPANYSYDADVLHWGIPDSDPNGDPITLLFAGAYKRVGLLSNDRQLQAGETSRNGTVAIVDNGTPDNPADDVIKYSPPPAYLGQDTFMYIITDGYGLYDTGFVYLNIDVTLMAEIEQIQVQQEGDKGVLIWKVEPHENRAAFTVERSVDGETFAELAQIPLDLDAQQKSTFQYDDLNLLSLQIYQFYYRVQQVDFDGNTSYSPSVELQIDQEDLPITLTIFPSPASDKVTLRYQAQGSFLIFEVKTTTGASIVKRDLPHPRGNYEVTQDIRSWASGVYYFQLRNERYSAVYKLVKK